MTPARITSCDCSCTTCRCQPGFGHCARGLAGPPPAADAVSLVEQEPAGDELEDSEAREEILGEALLELDGFDDEEPLPEFGDFWIDTDDVDAV
jgi:hypothetical protein